jgi:hypothetical protein
MARAGHIAAGKKFMEAEKWKWWWFVVVGILIGAYGIYEFTEWKIGQGIGSELLAVFCVVVGLFSRAAEKRGKAVPQAESQST